MKTLHLMRHGKSTWEVVSINDIDRPLLEKGIMNSYIMADRLKNKNSKADAIISSPAIRAMHTALILARVIGFDVSKIGISELIYNQKKDDLIELIQTFPNTFNNVILVGHNPIFSILSNTFISSFNEELSTSSIASITFKCDNWKDILTAETSINYDFPKKNN